MCNAAVREHSIPVADLVLPPPAWWVLEVALEAMKDVTSTVRSVGQIVGFERKKLHFYCLLHDNIGPWSACRHETGRTSAKGRTSCLSTVRFFARASSNSFFALSYACLSAGDGVGPSLDIWSCSDAREWWALRTVSRSRSAACSRHVAHHSGDAHLAGARLPRPPFGTLPSDTLSLTSSTSVMLAN